MSDLQPYINELDQLFRQRHTDKDVAAVLRGLVERTRQEDIEAMCKTCHDAAQERQLDPVSKARGSSEFGWTHWYGSTDCEVPCDAGPIHELREKDFSPGKSDQKEGANMNCNCERCLVIYGWIEHMMASHDATGKPIWRCPKCHSIMGRMEAKEPTSGFLKETTEVDSNKESTP